VQKALQQDTTLSGVSAQSGSDNKLVLTGTVPTKEDKHRAEQLARSAAGGMSIDNKIQVSGSSSTPGAMGGSTSGNPPPQGSTGANPPPPQGNSFLSSDAQYGSQTPDQGTAGQSSAGQTGQAGSQSSTGSQNPSSMSSGQGMGTQGQGASAQIQSALQQQPALSGVTVNETDSQIELSGNVAKSSDKKDAKKIAEQHAGGKKVVDKITVGQSK
jgi:osmotically-inducible protein OsmY